MSEPITETIETTETFDVTCPVCASMLRIPTKATRVETRELAVEAPAEVTVVHGGDGRPLTKGN